MSTYGVWVETLVRVEAENMTDAETVALAVAGIGTDEWEIEERTVTAIAEREA